MHELIGKVTIGGEDDEALAVLIEPAGAEEAQPGPFAGQEVEDRLLRVGVVLGSLWLALPDRYIPGAKVFSPWQGLAVLLVLVAVVKRPLVVIPVLMILGALSLFARPRT